VKKKVLFKNLDLV